VTSSVAFLSILLLKNLTQQFISTKGIKIKENREWNTTAEARGRIQVGTVWIQRGGTEFREKVQSELKFKVPKVYVSLRSVI
jgi:hypothetical protein